MVGESQMWSFRAGRTFKRSCNEIPFWLIELLYCSMSVMLSVALLWDSCIYVITHVLDQTCIPRICHKVVIEVGHYQAYRFVWQMSTIFQGRILLDLHRDILSSPQPNSFLLFALHYLRWSIQGKIESTLKNTRALHVFYVAPSPMIVSRARWDIFRNGLKSFFFHISWTPSTLGLVFIVFSNGWLRTQYLTASI